jgi:hypothetical protein
MGVNINITNTYPIRPPVLSQFLSLYFLALAAIIATPGYSAQTASGFGTYFKPYSNAGGDSIQYGDGGSCSFAQSCGTGFLNNGDPTPFAEEVVNINGANYFHVIVGDPATGFAQESFTPASVGRGSGFTGTDTLQAGFNPDGAGLERFYINDPTFNNTATVSGNYGSLANFMEKYSNGSDPFNTVHRSGDGGDNPANAVFHMVMTSAKGDMSLDVNKPFLDKKPIISQTVQDGTMSSTFVSDMSKLGYSDMNTPIKIINKVTFEDPDIPGNGAANFDMTNAQQSDVTAGRYTFTKGAGYGWNTGTTGWDAVGSKFTLGTYDYFGTPTGFDVYNTDWASFFNYDQNALGCLNNEIFVVDRRQDLGKGNGGLGSCPGH